METLENNIPVWVIIGIIALAIVIYIIYIFPKTEPINKNEIHEVNNLFLNKKYKNFTIVDFLQLMAKKYPKKSALKIKSNKIWKSVSYAKYYENVVNFSQSMNYWLGSNVNVAIIGFNSPGWFYSHMGCMLNGGISVGLYPTNTPKICQYIIKNSGVELLVVDDDDQLKKFIGLDIEPVKLIVYYSPIKSGIVEKFDIPVISMGSFMTEKNRNKKNMSIGNVATLIYTSGTNGTPKGVTITHKNIMSSLRGILNLINTKSTITNFSHEHFISYLPLSHIASQLMDIYIPIVTSGTVWFADKNALKSSIGATINEVRPTVFVGVPRIWEKISEQAQNQLSIQGITGSLTKVISPWKIVEKIGLDRCKMAITTTAPISEKAKYFLESIGIKLLDIYGMSETTGPVSISLPGLERNGSVGAPTMAIKISENGEVLVKGDNLFPGYFRNENETKKSFIKDGWFKTGDIGNLDKDGFLYITGRRKELIITSGGENISPIPLENKLKDLLGKYFDNIIVIGDKMRFISVLLNGTKDNIPKDIDNIVQNSINDVNKTAPSNASTIKKWLIINGKFKIGEELTPTLKLRRQFIQQKYNDKISKLYKN